MSKILFTMTSDVSVLEVLNHQNIYCAGRYFSETGLTEIENVPDGHTEQEIKDNFETWKQEYINYQPTKAVQENRRYSYPAMQDQLDMMYHDKIDDTTTWQDAIQAVKDANPKP